MKTRKEKKFIPIIHDISNSFIFIISHNCGLTRETVNGFYRNIIETAFSNRKILQKNLLEDHDFFELHKNNFALYNDYIDSFVASRFEYYGSYENFVKIKYEKNYELKTKITDPGYPYIQDNEEILYTLFYLIRENERGLEKTSDGRFRVRKRYILENNIYLREYLTKIYKNDTLYFIFYLYYIYKNFREQRDFKIFEKYIRDLYLYYVCMNKNTLELTLSHKIGIIGIFNAIEKTCLDPKIINQIIFHEMEDNSIFAKICDFAKSDFYIIQDLIGKKEEILNVCDKQEISNSVKNFVVLHENSFQNKVHFTGLRKAKSHKIDCYREKICIFPSDLDKDQIQSLKKITGVELSFIDCETMKKLLNVFDITYLLEQGQKM